MAEAARPDPRIGRRRAAVIRARRRRMAARVAALACAGAAGWALLFSPLLEVRRVVVVGERRASPAAVVRAAALAPGDNLLRISPAEVASRVERLAWVASAAVERRLPGTVVVRVRERRPAAVLTVGRARWTLDAAGRVLQAGSAAPGLPVVAASDPGEVRPGRPVGSPAVRNALAAYAAMPPGIRRQVEGLWAPGPERIGFALNGGIQVRLGAAEELADKAAVLSELLRKLRAEGRSGVYVDVREPQSPAVGPLRG